MILIDSDILMRLLRGDPSVKMWVASLPESPCISGFTAMEVLVGCKQRGKMDATFGSLSPFEVYWPDENGFKWALGEYKSKALIHGFGPNDAFIAATAYTHRAKLFSFNTKHLSSFEGVCSESPNIQPGSKD